MEIPAFLKEKLAAQYGGEGLERIAAGYGVRRCTTLRVNRLRASVDGVRRALEEAGIHTQAAPFYEDALIVLDAREDALAALPLYEHGEIYVQSLSSMIPPLLLGAMPGENVLDMAAAPGGKTTQIAALTGNGAMITACERNKARAERLKHNVSRQGASHVTVMNVDARQLDDLFAFDRVLLDAPCSGSGTVGEGFKGGFSREYLDRTVKMQATLLEKALRLLRPGHEMVYSTCSILEEENEAVVRQAIRRWGAELVPVDEPRFADVPRLPVTLAGTMCVCPDVHYEGFFVAKLRKRTRK